MRLLLRSLVRLDQVFFCLEVLMEILFVIPQGILIMFCSFLHCPKKNQKTLALDCSPTHYFLNSEIQRTRYAQTALDFYRIFEKWVPGWHSQRGVAKQEPLCLKYLSVLAFVPTGYSKDGEKVLIIKLCIMKIIERIKAPSPKFFRILRRIGLAMLAISGTIVAAPLVLPAGVVAVAGYLAVAGGVVSAVSQLVVADEKEEPLDTDGDGG